MPLHESAAKIEAREAVECVFERYKKLAQMRREKGTQEDVRRVRACYAVKRADAVVSKVVVRL